MTIRAPPPGLGLGLRVRVRGLELGSHSKSVGGRNAPICCSPTTKKTHIEEEKEDFLKINFNDFVAVLKFGPVGICI